MHLLFTPPNQFELVGSGAELSQLRARVLLAARREDGTLDVALDASVDPKPYASCLQTLTIGVAQGLVNVSLENASTLRIAGSPAALEGFASYLVVKPGECSHFEHYEGHQIIHEDALPLVISVE